MLVRITLFLALTILIGCSGGGPHVPAQQVAEPTMLETDFSALPQLSRNSGMNEGVLGAYWLIPDTAHPEKTELVPVRNTAADQGDLYMLSVRPFLVPGSLKLLNTAPAPDGDLDYTLEFTHPLPMPADLTPPATASKRVDLFLFDVNVVLLTEGTSPFFGGTIMADFDLVRNPDGYRQVGPLFDTAGLGILNTNVFPYKLISLNEPTDPAGNYSVADGWMDAEYLTPTGYDVFPQGASQQVTIRALSALPSPIAVLMLAKYMDPRGGATIDEKRANRLPNPDDPDAIRYYLPEACGDLQQIGVIVAGEVSDLSTTTTADMSIAVLDWDNSSPVAGAFPNPNLPIAIRQPSGPVGVAASFPDLSDTPFAAAGAGVVSGDLNQLVTLSIPVRNVAQTVVVPPGESLEVEGLIRIRDEQDDSADAFILLDENQLPLERPSTFEPSTRYQRAVVNVVSDKVRPTITNVTPQQGAPGQRITLVADVTGPTPTSWAWNLGGAATPNNPTTASPDVLLGTVGTYAASVVATNAYGTSVPFLFDLEVSPLPQVTSISPTGSAGFAGSTVTFSATTSGGTPTSWNWDFGAGASPAISTDQMPMVDLGAAGNYIGSLVVGNASGNALPFSFNYTVDVAGPPVITLVSPTGQIGTPGTSITFSAIASGSPSSWSWNFGGGATPNTSTSAQPEVLLGASGTYNGTVTATNTYGTSEVFPFSFTVTVNPQPPTVQSVTPTGSVGIPGNAVMFEASATNSPSSWSWNFGGGASPNTSSESQPTVTLSTPGTYDGFVTATNAIGTSPAFPFEFTVAAPPIPIVSSVSPTGTVGATGNIIEFSAIASGNPTSWSWSFGGGASPNTSTNTTPSVTLGQPNTYTGTVTATNASGTSTPHQFQFTVTPPPAPTITSVVPTGAIGGVGDAIEFSAVATNSPTSWNWNFGGGAIPNTSTNATPDVALGAVGDYEGTVTATNAGGTSIPYPFTFTVSAAPPVPIIFSVDPTGNVGFAGTDVTFSASITGNPTQWAWNFGGGAIPNLSGEESPTITLGAAGSYEGTLIAVNGAGPSDPFHFSFSIDPRPVPVVQSVTPTGILGYPTQQVQFSAVITGDPTSWNWTLHGTNPPLPTVESPLVTLTSIGTRTGSLIATNSWGPSEPFEFEYTITPPPKPVVTSVTPAGSVGNPGDAVIFEATATFEPISWSWNFGGGAAPNTSTDPTPTANLGVNGTFTGSVTATNLGGTSDPFPFSFTVDDNPPEWEPHVIAGGVSSDFHMADLDGYIGIAYYDPVNQDLKFARALTLDPKKPEDWQIHTVDANGDAGRSPQVCTYNNIDLAWTIGYYRNNGSPKAVFAIASTLTPESSADWRMREIADCAVPAAGEKIIGLEFYSGYILAYKNPSGKLQAGCTVYGFDPITTIWHITNMDPTMDVASSVTVYQKVASSFVYYSTTGELRIIRLKEGSQRGTFDHDWVQMTLATPTAIGSSMEISRRGGDGNVLYEDLSSGTGILKRVELETPYWTTLSDFTFTTIDNVGDVGNGSCWTDIGSEWAASYYDTGAQQLKVARSKTATPASPADWKFAYPDEGLQTGLASEIWAINNRVIVVYYDGANDQLKFTRADRPW